MRKIERIIIIFISIVSIGFFVCLFSLYYPLPVIADFVKDKIAEYPWLNTVFAVYSAFMGLCFFALFLFGVFAPPRSRILTLHKSKGKLEFTRKTVEATARYSFADVEGISFCDVRAKLGRQPGMTKIFVTVSLSELNEVVTLTETIQNKIAAVMQDSLGITAKDVTVKVVSHNPAVKKEQENNKNSRVV